MIFAETAQDLQEALDAMQRHCNTRHLKVNTSNTIKVIFSKGKLWNKPYFMLNNDHLEVVDDFDYLGIRLTAMGSLPKIRRG